MNDLKFDRTVSAAFTGHRFYDFSQREFIQERLTSAISEAYDHGIRNFISGFALGIDLMAAQLVQSLKCNLSGISLTAAIPFEGQAERYNIYDKRVYRRLLELADKVIVLSDCYYPRCFLDRDEFMVENASYLIAYYDGREKGGTYYTVKKARARGIPIINVY
ncbi:SLOG family protein [Bacteroides caecigallinarum]|uniref:SLOG family protein n=1 Tax=Bacteroides caecigallinarum TaxID=1411144 RepID=UPI001EF59D9B|nr:SLOG family protein [Bacteroides caecigallinarum]